MKIQDMNIKAMNIRQLVAVLKHLKGGAIGFDPFRDDRTKTKLALLQFILANHSNDQIIASVNAIANDHQNDQQAVKAPEDAEDALFPPTREKQPKHAETDDASKLAELIANLARGKAALDPDQINKLIDSRLSDIDAKIRASVDAAKIRPAIVEIRQAEKEAVVLKERTNPAFDEIIQMAAHYPNVMLVGPAGSGKTYLCQQVARALGRTHASVSCTAGTSETEFTGRLLPTGDGGKFELHATPFLTQYESDAGSFNIDEADNLDANTFGVLNQATANGGFEIAARQAAGLDTHVKRGKSILFACTNTYGTGADSIYVGRNPLDGASMDRWYIIPVDYDRELEQELLSGEMLAWAWRLRDKVQENRLRRVVSTRLIQKISAAKRAGRPDREIKERLIGGWSRDERTKVGM